MFNLFPTSDINHLQLLIRALEPIYEWFQLGLHIGVNHATLKKIEIEERERVEDCKREMLAEWLRSWERPTKEHLTTALWNISFTRTMTETT